MPKKRNIWGLYAIALLQGMVFYAPISTLYRKAAGISMLEIGLIESISLVLSLLLEMPWGVVADRIGYKNTMVVCCGLFFVSKIIFWRAESFAAFLSERIVLSVVISGLSGVDSALLYLSCPPERQQKTFAMYQSLGTAGLLMASLLYSLCFGGNYRLAGFWTMAAYAAALVASFFLEEPGHPEIRKKESGLLRCAIFSVMRRPRLLLLLLGFGLFQETRQTVTVFLNQLQYERASIPGELLGILHAGMQLLGFLAIFSHHLTDRIGEKRSFLLLMGVGGFSCLLMAQTSSPLLSVLGVAALVLAGSFLSPLQAVVQNREVQTPFRATELSVYAMVLDGISAGANVAFGRAADVSLPLALWIGAGACGAACVLYLVAARPSRSRRSGGRAG